MEAAEWEIVRVRRGGYERRAAERYECLLPRAVKDAQRASVADWLIQHHSPGSQLRLLSLPDRYWIFENQMNVRPNMTFFGLQRDWRTLELSIPWMPAPYGIRPETIEGSAYPFSVTAPPGDLVGYRRGRNIVLHMWAGHLLSWDVISRDLGQPRMRSQWKRLRRVTAAWLDFTGCLTNEVVAATTGIPTVLGGSNADFPVVISFLASRDDFHDHDERVSHLLIALQQQQRRWSVWRFQFHRYEVHAEISTFISVFGIYRNVE
jgi:hypothetical protein